MGLAVNLDMITDRDFIVPIQNAYLNVFGTCLDDLEQTFNRQLNRLLLRHIVFVVFLQELSYSFG